MRVEDDTGYEVGGLKGWHIRHNTGDVREHTRPPKRWKPYHVDRRRNGLLHSHDAWLRRGWIPSSSRRFQKRLLIKQFRMRSRTALARGDFEIPRLGASWLT